MSHNLLKQGITTIKAGNKERGKQLLLQVLESDRDNELAWLWLSVCLDEPHLKQRCFEEVLRINPDNEKAKDALRRLVAKEKVKKSPKKISHAKKPKRKSSRQVSPTTKECPKCAETIKAKATVCQYCGYDFKKARTKRIRSVLVAVCAIALCGCCMFASGSFTDVTTSMSQTPRSTFLTRTPRPTFEYEPDEWDAYTYCQEFVERNLNAPSTAEFPPQHEVSVIDEGGVWTVIGYVDAQNAFGAMVRTYYICKVEYYKDTEKWHLVDLAFE